VTTIRRQQRSAIAPSTPIAISLMGIRNKQTRTAVFWQHPVARCPPDGTKERILFDRTHANDSQAGDWKSQRHRSAENKSASASPIRYVPCPFFYIRRV
jgi:hypothetical protein